MGVLITAVALIILVVGFAAGFAAFKRSHAWCRRCGNTLNCAVCEPNRRPDVRACSR